MDSSEFTNALSRFASGVTVVTALNNDGTPVGVTVSAFCSLSLTPPLVLICLGKSTRDLEAYSAGTHFAVNMLAADQAELSNRFAGRQDDKFADLTTRTGAGGCLLLEQTAGWLECRRTRVVDEGDHLIIIGEVLACGVSEAEPLLYHRGQYRRLQSAGDSAA